VSSKLGAAAEAVARECARKGAGEIDIAIVIFARREGSQMRVCTGVAGVNREVSEEEAAAMLQWAIADVMQGRGL